MINVRRLRTTSIELNNLHISVFKIFERTATKIETAEIESFDLTTYPIERFIQLRSDEMIRIEECCSKTMISYRHQFFRFTFWQYNIEILFIPNTQHIPLQLCTIE